MKKLLVLLLALCCCFSMTGCTTIAALVFNAAAEQSVTEENRSVAEEVSDSEEIFDANPSESFAADLGDALQFYLEGNYDEDFEAELRARLEEIYGEDYEEELRRYLEEIYGEDYEAAIEAFILESYDAYINNSASAEDITPTPEPAAEPTVENLVITAYETHLQGTDSVGNSYDCIYRIPAFTFDTPEAHEANAYLMDWLLPYIEEQQACHESGVSILISEMDYDAWIYKDVLTVMVTVHTDWSQSYYEIYSVDAYTGEFLDNDDILEKLGVSYDMFLDTMYSMIESMYDISDPGAVELEFVIQQLENTLSEENLNAATVFLDENGNPKLHITIYALAGADSYEHILDLPIA